MKVIKTPIEDLIIIECDIHRDERGHFLEVFQSERYLHHGIPNFVQDNLSRSKKDSLRGLHYQSPMAQGKLVWVPRGEVWDVAVDIRPHSKTFGQWFSVVLNETNGKQLYIPPGFAHGFCVLSEEADFFYKCTEYYAPQYERGILWNDKNLDICWPINNPIISMKDQANLPFEVSRFDTEFA